MPGVARLAAWQVWQRATGRPFTVRTADGLRLKCYPHSPQASAVIYTGMPEYRDVHFVRDYLTAGDRFIDVGANVGVFTLTVASVAGSVAEAFEPSSTAFPRLVENIELNLLGAPSACPSCGGRTGARNGPPHHGAGCDEPDRGRGSS